MSIQNYGKKLMREGALSCEPPYLIKYDFEKIWPVDFAESIVFYSCKIEQFQSCLNFFWQTVFDQRDVKCIEEADEIFTATQFIDMDLEEARAKIKSINSEWYMENSHLIPDAKWTHIIWDDEDDVYLLFENEEKYYAWSWDINSGFI